MNQEQPLQRSPSPPPEWWVLPLVIGAIVFILIIFTNETYQAALSVLIDGLGRTLRIITLTLIAASILGLLIALCRLSRFLLLNQAAALYIEITNGVPLVVLVLYVALILVPKSANELNSSWLHNLSYEARFIAALALAYAGFIGYSISNSWLATSRNHQWLVGVRLGSNLINLIKDSALATILAVPDVTYIARLEYASAVDAAPVFHTLIFLYLAITITLNLIFKRLEHALISPNDRLTKDGLGITN